MPNKKFVSPKITFVGEENEEGKVSCSLLSRFSTLTLSKLFHIGQLRNLGCRVEDNVLQTLRIGIGRIGKARKGGSKSRTRFTFSSFKSYVKRPELVQFWRCRDKTDVSWRSLDMRYRAYDNRIRFL